ncbi:MAG: DUF502 domain-containing protein [Kiritimatiellae bacterium]|nr:DUF502 domain-containing protein [Kiritimatiellia bacterium]
MKISRSRIFSGLLLLVPLFVTVAILRLIFDLAARYVRPLLKISRNLPVPEYAVILATVLVMLIGLYLLGLLAQRVVGRRIISWVEGLMEKIPIVRSIYSGTRGIVRVLAADKRQAFQCVVVIEHPRPGMYALAFVTGTFRDSSGARFAKIFLPTVPNPTSGSMLLLPWPEVRVLDLSTEDALRMILSGGMLSPEHINITSARPLSDADIHDLEANPAPGDVP